MIRLDLCGDDLSDFDPDAPCDAVADGASRTTVRACAGEQVAIRANPVQAELRASSGTWWPSDDGGTVTVDLSVSPCAEVQLVPASTDQQVRLDASLGGYVHTRYLDLEPAGLADIVITPSVWVLPDAGGTTSLTVSVVARGAGTLSTGSTVSVVIADEQQDQVDPDTAGEEPDTAPSTLWPDAAVLDAEGKAEFSLVTQAVTTSVQVQVTASPPAWHDQQADALVETLTLTAN